MMELVIAAELQLSVLLNLDVDNVILVAIIRQNYFQNRPDGIVFKR